MWAFLSGISEPIGALIGYIFLATIVGDAMYGVLFGIVSGMMVFIALKVCDH
jgi:ZIP family zinc transporter